MHLCVCVTAGDAAFHRVSVTENDTSPSMHVCSCPCVNRWTDVYKWDICVSLSTGVDVSVHVLVDTSRGTSNVNKCVGSR